MRGGKCRCLRCRFTLVREAHWWRERLKGLWNRYVACRVRGHEVPGPLSWKHFCRYCWGACPVCRTIGTDCPGTSRRER